MLNIDQVVRKRRLDQDEFYSSEFMFQFSDSFPVGNYDITIAPEEISQSGMSHLDAALKRSFDIGFALCFLIVSLPFLALLALVLQIDSKGPILFVQQRVGRAGQLFRCYKFRTMRADADAVLAEILASSPEARQEWEADHKLRSDPRVSRFGKLVRKLSLDELPQLYNILVGEMSVVGPRPIVQAEIVKYGQYFLDYCAVKPGLTGLWQVSGRNDVSYAERVQLDCEYRRKASFLFDMGIVARTVPAVLLASGSY